MDGRTIDKVLATPIPESADADPPVQAAVGA
jgi:hypothetical protein